MLTLVVVGCVVFIFVFAMLTILLYAACRGFGEPPAATDFDWADDFLDRDDDT